MWSRSGRTKVIWLPSLCSEPPHYNPSAGEVQWLPGLCKTGGHMLLFNSRSVENQSNLGGPNQALFRERIYPANRFWFSSFLWFKAVSTVGLDVSSLLSLTILNILIMQIISRLLRSLLASSFLIII